MGGWNGNGGWQQVSGHIFVDFVDFIDELVDRLHNGLLHIYQPSRQSLSILCASLLLPHVCSAQCA